MRATPFLSFLVEMNLSMTANVKHTAHRRSQWDQRDHGPPNVWKYSHFVLREAFFQTK